jgi:hypothetical protein
MPKTFPNVLIYINSKYPYKELCYLCEKIITNFQIRFYYDHIVNNGTSPKNIGQFCTELLSENFAVVHVDMVAKSVTRAVKDQRFNFVTKLSSLGELSDSAFIGNVS